MRSFGRSVPAMTAAAVGVLVALMKPGQLRARVAAGARRRRRHAVGAVGTVTSLATAVRLAVRRRRLALMTALARVFLSAGVSLVTARAGAMASRRRRLLALVATRTADGLRAVVRLVTTGTLGVSRDDAGVLSGMTAVAPGLG